MKRSAEYYRNRQERRLNRHPNGVCNENECHFTHGRVAHYRVGCRCDDCSKVWRKQQKAAQKRFRERHSPVIHIRQWAQTQPQFEGVIKAKGRIPEHIVEAYNIWNNGG